MGGTEKSPLLPLSAPSSSLSSFSHSPRPRVGCLERRRRKKLLAKFYSEQADILDQYARDEQLLEGCIQPMEVERRTDRILNRILFCLNVVLLFANLAAAMLSGSLSIVSTFVDSAMDLTTSIILGVCLHLIKNANEFQYPRGRERLEMLGVILCSVIMGISNMVIILQSVEAIVGDMIHPDMTLATLAILLSGCSLKLILMFICFQRGTASSKASSHLCIVVLAMDMRNDIATSAVAIVSAFVGDRFWKYADPIGAILVCGMIALTWFGHALEHIPSMTGVRGEQEQLSRILKIAIEHDDRIQAIDHVMIYHIGAKAIVEMHIVMNENLPLKITHDISHPLEKKLNLLEFVERSFVHCDYDCDGD